MKKKDLLARRRRLDARQGYGRLPCTLPLNPDPHAYNAGLPAKCYIAAYRVAMDLAFEDIAGGVVSICHGVVRCHAMGDVLILHEWTEVVFPSGLAIAIDASNSKRTEIAVLERSAYYQIGDVKPEAVRHYQLDEWLALSLKLEHYGPWRAPLTWASDWTAVDIAKLDAEGFYLG